MYLCSYKILQKFIPFGVISREEAKNDLAAIRSLARRGIVRKAYKKGRVFYEFTPTALPLLDAWRKVLLYLAEFKSHLYPRRKQFYHALTEDVRFLDSTREEAGNFLFLGDWQLSRRPVSSQLLLSQWRFYQSRGLS